MSDKQSVEISSIQDVNILKTWAYDSIVQLEQTQSNLRLLNQRIAELQAPMPAEKPEVKK